MFFTKNTNAPGFYFVQFAPKPLCMARTLTWRFRTRSVYLKLIHCSFLLLMCFSFFFCVLSYITGVHHSYSSSSVFPAISLGFTILLLCSQLYLCVPSYISGVHHSSSSVFPAISLGFTILLLLCSQLYLWGSLFFFFFFCVPSYISLSVFPAISLGFTILILLLCSQLYLGGSSFFFFFCVPSYISVCVPSYISGVHHSSSSSVFPVISLSVFPAISLGFTILFLLLLCSQLYLWGSPFFFFCVPSYISGVHYFSSSSVFPAISLSVFPAISLGFTILLLLLCSQLYLCLCSQLYLWGSPFFLFFFCVPSLISGVHHSSFCFLRSQLYLWGSPFWVRFLHMWPVFNPTIEVVTFHLRGWCILGVFYFQHSPVLDMNVRIFWICTMECMCTQTLIQRVYHLVGLVVKASASRAEGPGFESRLRRDFFGVESYQWLKNWHSSGYPARRLAL